MEIVYRTHPGEGEKARPEWYDKRVCFESLLGCFNWRGGENTLHLVVDRGDREFIQGLLVACDAYRANRSVVEITADNGAHAFELALDYAIGLEGDLYFVEDDYLHRLGAAAVLKEGLRYGRYATGYDHPDKYSEDHEHSGNYFENASQVRLWPGERCHWREAVSTTETFAVRAEDLREDADVWRYWARQADWRLGHTAFFDLGNRAVETHWEEYSLASSGYSTHCAADPEKCLLVSSVPGYSTHCESKWLSPAVGWADIAFGWFNWMRAPDPGGPS